MLTSGLLYNTSELKCDDLTNTLVKHNQTSVVDIVSVVAVWVVEGIFHTS